MLSAIAPGMPHHGPMRNVGSRSKRLADWATWPMGTGNNAWRPMPNRSLAPASDLGSMHVPVVPPMPPMSAPINHMKMNHGPKNHGSMHHGPLHHGPLHHEQLHTSMPPMPMAHNEGYGGFNGGFDSTAHVRAKVLAGLAAWQLDLTKINAKFFAHCDSLKEHVNVLDQACESAASTPYVDGINVDDKDDTAVLMEWATPESISLLQS